MQRYILLWFLVISGFIFNAKWALAQSSDASDDRDLDQIEAEIKKNETKPVPIPVAPSNPANSSKDVSAAEKDVPPEVKIDTLSDLSKLQPFSEVTVLQRRYMPKSGRIQLFAGLSDMVNDPWNNTAGLNVRAGYSFTEAWGLEVAYYALSASPTQAAQGLLSQNNVNAQSLGYVTGFTGGYLTWTPIYGKMSFGTKKIVPFDMYFSVGGGQTSLSSVPQSGSTLGVPSTASGLSLATGQIYAITRSVGFRWDLNLNTYTIPTGATNNILLTLGANWYFPEASYR